MEKIKDFFKVSNLQDIGATILFVIIVIVIIAFLFDFLVGLAKRFLFLALLGTLVAILYMGYLKFHPINSNTNNIEEETTISYEENNDYDNNEEENLVEEENSEENEVIEDIGE